MNPIINAMLERRSIRRYSPEMLSKEVIDEIIRAGIYAPSGMGQQATIILAVTNRELRDRLAEMNRKIGVEVYNFPWKEGHDPFFGAPVVLIVLGNRVRHTYVYDGSLVMGNMLLAAHALGLGGCWIHRAKEMFDSPEGKAILASLGVEGDYEGIGCCIIGKIEGAVPKAAARKEHRVFYAD